MYGLEGRPLAGSAPAASASASWQHQPGELTGQAVDPTSHNHFGPQWVLIKFDQPVTAPADSLVIGARLDADMHGESCRLAFYGRLLHVLEPANPKELAALKVYKVRLRVDMGGAALDHALVTCRCGIVCPDRVLLVALSCWSDPRCSKSQCSGHKHQITLCLHCLHLLSVTTHTSHFLFAISEQHTLARHT